MILLAFLLGRSSTRRGRSPVGFVLAWLLIIGLCIAFWPYFLAIGVPIIVALVGLGALRRRRPTPSGRGSAPGQAPATEPASETVVFRAQCDHCGSPRLHGAEACRYCGRSLVVARATVS